MDIGKGNGFPASSLSNFAGHRFVLDGIVCNSMEGFLQALKFSNPEMQVYVCTLIGLKAKFKGKKKKWWVKQQLYWKGVVIKRGSQEYQDLLDRAYQAMFDQNKSFNRILLKTGKAALTHSIGKSDMSRTVLTEKEFCGRLIRLRRDGVL